MNYLPPYGPGVLNLDKKCPTCGKKIGGFILRENEPKEMFRAHCNHCGQYLCAEGRENAYVESFSKANVSIDTVIAWLSSDIYCEIIDVKADLAFRETYNGLEWYFTFFQCEYIPLVYGHCYNLVMEADSDGLFRNGRKEIQKRLNPYISDINVELLNIYRSGYYPGGGGYKAHCGILMFESKKLCKIAWDNFNKE